MEKVTFYSSIDGIYLERMIRHGKFDMKVRHFHNEYEIFYLVDGQRDFFFDNRAYRVKSGSLILVDTNSIHMTRAISDDDLGHDRIILYITQQKMKNLERYFPKLSLILFFKENYGVFDLTPHQQQEFMEMYHSLQNEFENQSPNYQYMIEMYILQYFIQFMRDAHTKTPIQNIGLISHKDNNKSNKYHTVYNVTDYIFEHYNERLTLDFLARKFYISKYYLSRIFKEITGYGVNEYINILRTKNSKKLLEETNLTISEIAQQVGYESITYFEKVFKIYMTMSPLKYRKTLNIVTYTNDIPVTETFKLLSTPTDQEQ